MKKKAIYPGSFDPITYGHIDIVERALRVFDEVIITVASNLRKSKNAWFTPEERKKMIQKIFAGDKRIKVEVCTGLVVDFARKNGACGILRGLRAASDFESEFMMAAMNKELYPKVETFFIMTGKNLYFISSTMLKEVASYGGDVSAYVPKSVAREMSKKVGGP